MNKFLIIVAENKISVSECSGGEYTPLKREGEEKQPYDKVTFWQWFQKKLDYGGEALSFVVISDEEDFSIADDIILSEVNHFQTDTLCRKKLQQHTKKHKILSFPLIESLSQPLPSQEEEPTKIDTNLNENFTKPNIADIFKKQTREYQNG